jgi:hypothetical protein
MTAKHLAGAGVCIVIVALVAALAIHQLQPPEAAPSGVPPADFSASRAMRHVEVIAKEPHPVGSAAHAEVSRYILGEVSALGLNPEAQDTNGVRNILVRLEGAEMSKAILLVAHYDTVRGSPGAADDSSAVAAMLETLRALRSGAGLKNSVICLFSDAEEVGLKGAEAFAYSHPWAADVRLVLNFDARGNGGPALMFETSGGNSWLVEQFARAAPHPRATSLSYDLYKLLPNDTDFTVFKEARMAGLNFALVKGFDYYHSPRDTFENLDPRSLQHQGSYALALTRHFGNLDLESRGDGDAVYFNLPGYGLVVYSQKWVTPIAILSALAFAVVTAFGWRRGRVTFSGMAKGVAASTLNVIVVLAALWLAGLLADAAGIFGSRGDGRDGDVHALLLVSLTVVAAAAFHVWFSRALRGNAGGLLAGGLFCWLGLALLTSLFLPGGSYLFAWPLLSGLPALAYLSAVRTEGEASSARLIVLTVCVLPAVALLTPVIYLSLITFTVRSALSVVVIAVPAVLVTSLLAPQFASPLPPRRGPSRSRGRYGDPHVAETVCQAKN